MASGTMGPSADSLSPNGSLDAYPSAITSEDTSRQPSPSRTVPKSPPRNGIPPKRLSMTKRSAPATAAASSRSNPPVASRGTPGTGLSKPPTRPSISSAARRPATAATNPSTGHRKRPSLASNEINSIKRGDLNGAEENIRPPGSRPEARRNVYDKGDFKSAVQISNEDRSNLAAASGRMGNSSPTKSVLRTTTNSSRPSSMHTPSRGTRPLASSAGGAPKVEPTKKRLSTIPASPAPAYYENITPGSSMPLAATQTKRPVLHSRKSTMSVTIEQRLKEMELVHEMLRVAMAEDGEDEDEVKEEYGRKVDESLASLRVRLEEARRNEGINPEENEVGKNSTGHSSGVSMNQATSGDGKLVEALHESEGKVLALNDEISDLRRRLQQATSSIDTAAEVSHEPGALTDTQQKWQEEIRRLQETQALKMKELSENHQTDLAATRAEKDEAESRYQAELARLSQNQADAIALAVSECSAEAANKLESEVNAYTLKLQMAELDLAAERQSSASMSEDLQLEVSRLRSVLAQERQRLAEMKRRSDEHVELLDEKQDMILRKERELQDLHKKHARQLEEVEKASLDNRSHLENELNMVRNALSHLESSHQSVITSHERQITSKDEEIEGLAQAIEGLQNQVQATHEQKEREVNEAKLDLIEEHEKVVSDLNQKHHDETANMALSNEKNLQTLRAKHENALESARDQYTSRLRGLDELLETSESRQETLELEVFNAKATVEKLEMEVTILRCEKAELNETFQDSSDELTGLKTTLETLGHDAEDKDRLHAAAIKKLEEELAEVKKALVERDTKRETTLKCHLEEIESMSRLHAADTKALESQSRETLIEWQKKHEELVDQSIVTEREYREDLEELKSDHAETLEKHATDLEHLIKTHATETRDKLDQIDKMHQEEIKALVQITDQKYESLCQEMKIAKEQLQQYKDSRDALVMQTERCEGLAKSVESLESELAKTQVELGQANVEVTRLIAEVEEARKTLQDSTESDHLRYEMFELTRQHAAEIARVQETVTVENEKRAKERKQGAEVRDRLVSETEKLTNDLAAAKLETDKYRMDLHMAKEEEIKKNDAHRQSIEAHKAGHRKAADDLKVARAEIEKLKSALVERQREESESSNINQELEALQIAADAEREQNAKLQEQNAKLQEQIREATATAERQATKLREVECALKVTTAELVEAQTVRPNSSEYLASPVPRTGLRSSRWAIPDVGDQMDVVSGEDDDDEDLGSTISGNMAGMQEQIRQMEDIHRDMLEEERRMMEKLSSIVNTPLLPSSASFATSSSARETNGIDEDDL